MGTVDDPIPYEAGSRLGVNSSFSTINFLDVNASCFLADLQTFNGPDTANLRYKNLTPITASPTYLAFAAALNTPNTPR